jgi:hypothetical protein
MGGYYAASAGPRLARAAQRDLQIAAGREDLVDAADGADLVAEPLGRVERVLRLDAVRLEQAAELVGDLVEVGPLELEQRARVEQLEQPARPGGHLLGAQRRLGVEHARRRPAVRRRVLVDGLLGEVLRDRGQHAREARARERTGGLAARREGGLAVDVAHHEEAARDAALEADLGAEVAALDEAQERVARDRPGDAVLARDGERQAVGVGDLERVGAPRVAARGAVAVDGLDDVERAVVAQHHRHDLIVGGGPHAEHARGVLRDRVQRIERIQDLRAIARDEGVIAVLAPDQERVALRLAEPAAREIDPLRHHLDQEAVGDVADRRLGHLDLPLVMAVRRDVREPVQVPAVDAAAVAGLVPERVLGVDELRRAARRVQAEHDVLHEGTEVVGDQERLHAIRRCC